MCIASQAEVGMCIYLGKRLVHSEITYIGCMCIRMYVRTVEIF